MSNIELVQIDKKIDMLHRAGYRRTKLTVADTRN